MSFSEESLRPLFSPYLNSIEEVIRNGFRDYKLSSTEVSRLHCARTRASAINDHIASNAKNKFFQLGISCINKQQRILFDFNGGFLLHFKKLGSNLKASNYPTLSALLFNEQLELPGLPATVPRLIAGYVPTRDWSSIESVYLTCPKGDHLEWSIDLSAENSRNITSYLTPFHAEKPTRKQRFRRIALAGETAAES